jgi:hypothetical protein
MSRPAAPAVRATLFSMPRQMSRRAGWASQCAHACAETMLIFGFGRARNPSDSAVAIGLEPLFLFICAIDAAICGRASGAAAGRERPFTIASGTSGSAANGCPCSSMR